MFYILRGNLKEFKTTGKWYVYNDVMYVEVKYTVKQEEVVAGRWVFSTLELVYTDVEVCMFAQEQDFVWVNTCTSSMSANDKMMKGLAEL